MAVDSHSYSEVYFGYFPATDEVELSIIPSDGDWTPSSSHTFFKCNLFGQIRFFNDDPTTNPSPELDELIPHLEVRLTASCV